MWERELGASTAFHPLEVGRRGRETSNASMTFHPLFGLFLGKEKKERKKERKEGRNTRVKSKREERRKVEEIWRFFVRSIGA